MKLKIITVFVLMLAFLVCPALSFEWHSGTWTAWYSDGSFPVTNLASGGTWQATASASWGWACYDVGNTSFTLKQVDLGVVDVTPDSSIFYIATASSCNNAVGYSVPFSDSVGRSIVTNFSSPSRYYRFQHDSGSFRKLSDLKLYWNSLPDTVINFTGTPLDGYSPLSVSFTATGLTNTTGMSWSFGDGNVTQTTSAVVSHIYQNPGSYTVRLNYFNNSGVAGYVQKNDYVLVSNPSGLIVNVDVNDAITGAYILDVGVGIKNTSTGVWRNGTIPFGQAYYSTTDPGYLYPISANQSITFAANKTGYRDDSQTVSIPYNNYRVYLKLVPLTVVNSTGTGTVVVNVVSNKNGLTMPGISVVLDSGQIGTTNSAGSVTLYNVTAGTRYVTLTDPNKVYQSAKSSFALTAGETKLISLQMVRVGETPVVTQVSPTPTGTGTYDPKNPNSKVYGNLSTSEINQQGGAGVLGMLAELIGLWPLVVLGVFMKFMKSAFT